MVPYNQDKFANLSSMNATIVLDEQPANSSYTNLDQISGRAIVRCSKSADISSIVVKLEGESWSRLLSPPNPQTGDRPKPQVEQHKILYKVAMVFPPPDVIEGRSHLSTGKSAYTLPPGTHEYPFRLKIPFNSNCTEDRTQLPAILGLEAVKPAPRHIKQTLPPTLTGFPGEAKIEYYVKVTVNRHSIFKENPRAFVPFNFFPIEPPRAAATGSEIYARQKHNFGSFPESDSSKSKMKGLFNKKSSAPSSPTSTAESPFFSVDARLPEPAILTCNNDIPLRIIVKKLSNYKQPIYLQSLQVSLIGTTKIRAHQLYRSEATSWIIMSKSNMGISIGSASDPVDKETVIEDRLWRGQPLPNTVAPTFETCNISRSYQLDVRVGLNYPNGSKPQSVVLPLRLDTQIYSGIAPPAEVLQRMANTQDRIHNAGRKMSTTKSEPSKLQTEARMTSEFGANQVPPTPMEASGSASSMAFPAHPGQAHAEEYDDAPPSYEDAIASDLPPVDGPRPDYAPPPPPPLGAGDDTTRRNEKRGWV